MQECRKSLLGSMKKKRKFHPWFVGNNNNVKFNSNWILKNKEARINKEISPLSLLFSCSTQIEREKLSTEIRKSIELELDIFNKIFSFLSYNPMNCEIILNGTACHIHDWFLK